MLCFGSAQRDEYLGYGLVIFNVLKNGSSLSLIRNLVIIQS